QELLNRAASASIALTPRQREELHGLAQEMAATEANTKAMHEALSFAKGTTKAALSEVFRSLREGESVWKAFGDAATGALDRIVDKKEDSALDAMMGQGEQA